MRGALQLPAATLLAAAFATASPLAIAHDEKPQYGGVVQAVKDVAYELVQRGDEFTLYVDDHGNPVATAGIVGKLVLVRGSHRTEAELRPAGGNRLVAKSMPADAGLKATAVLTMPSGRAVVVHFPRHQSR
jgi:hypothetical protein